MDWQQVVSLMIVGAAAAALVWSRVRRRKAVHKRGVTCLCPAAGGAADQPKMLFHARKNGERTVTMKDENAGVQPRVDTDAGHLVD